MQGDEVITPKDPITDSERRAAVELVLSSALLSRAARLRRFLSYAVEETIKDDPTPLTEQRIGVALFGRRPSYDTGADNIVRVNATELRKRLEQFYSGAGAAETLIIEIPRGSYKPVFVRRTPPATAPSSVGSPPLPLPVFDSPLSSPEVLLPLAVADRPATQGGIVWLLAAALVLAVVFGLWQTHRANGLQARLEPWQTEPALRALWGNFFNGHAETTIVLADTSYAMAQDVSGYHLTLDDYQQRRFGAVAKQRLSANSEGQANGHILDLLLSRYSGSIGDFYTARRIQALQPASPALKIQFARDFSGEMLRHNSSVLLGSTRSNPWVEPFESELFFHLITSADGHSIEVRVDNPQHGEQAVYKTSSDPNRMDGFCVIALLPGLGGTGRTMILAGTDSQATEAGGDFVTQEQTLEQLQQRLPKGFGTFQALLRTSRVAGSPLAAEIISIR